MNERIAAAKLAYDIAAGQRTALAHRIAFFAVRGELPEPSLAAAYLEADDKTGLTFTAYETAADDGATIAN